MKPTGGTEQEELRFFQVSKQVICDGNLGIGKGRELGSIFSAQLKINIIKQYSKMLAAQCTNLQDTMYSYKFKQHIMLAYCIPRNIFPSIHTSWCYFNKQQCGRACKCTWSSLSLKYLASLSLEKVILRPGAMP